ncbi:MAG: hypothetical protein COB41_03435 [Proteobacteria bacterium]|nr:MAG: hypothetical protein COB41_03435 [Pseudomonadota bacterium]
MKHHESHKPRLSNITGIAVGCPARGCINPLGLDEKKLLALRLKKADSLYQSLKSLQKVQHDIEDKIVRSVRG